jgi:acyl-CoA-binding protein
MIGTGLFLSQSGHTFPVSIAVNPSLSPVICHLISPLPASFLYLHPNQFFTMDLKEQFEAAVADSKTLSQKPSNETLLQLYSLYKQATEGDAPDEGPSNPFDFVAKAKHNAWSELKGKSADNAMSEYITLVGNLKG